MLLKTEVEVLNACILDALGLPGLARLPGCPDGMRMVSSEDVGGPGRIPMLNETPWYREVAADPD